MTALVGGVELPPRSAALPAKPDSASGRQFDTHYSPSNFSAQPLMQ